jgi:hypothetical protein
MMLGVNIIFEVVITVIFSSVLAFALLLILRKICSVKRIFLPFAHLRTQRIALTISIFSILLFILLVGILDISARNEIASLFENMKRCTSLKVFNSLMGRKGEETVITDHQLTESLTALMSRDNYKKMTSKGVLATNDYVEIRVYNNQKEIVLFRVIGGYVLEFGERTSVRSRYHCSDKEFLWKVRHALGLTVVG